MNETREDTVLKITATDRASMDTKLAQAELALREEAIRTRRGGILITRETCSSFSLQISEQVPFGLTRERMSWGS